MFTRTKCLAVIAGALLFAMPATSEAQVRIGIGGGGGRYYGGGGGGYGYGRYSPGYGGYGYGGPGFGYGGYGSGISIGLGSGYGYRNGYYNNGFYNNGYSGNGYYSNGYYAAPAVVSVQPAIAPSYQAFYPPVGSAPVQTSEGTALVEVIVPENAQVMWNGLQSSTTGTMRRFRTAPLSADGGTQSFQVRWTGADGQPVTQTREVRVTPNTTVVVDFTRPAPNDPNTGVK